MEMVLSTFLNSPCLWLIPYDNLLSKGKVIRAKVTEINGDSVTLTDGTQLEADYIVVATGSSNGGAFKPAGDNIDDFRAVVTDLSAKVKAAKTITIVGAGTVGTEMAGEIIHAMPDKKITLISSEETLFPQMPAKFGASIQSKLEKSNVDVRFGVRVENLASLTDPYTGSVTLSDGSTIDADLIIPAIGSRAVSEVLNTLPNVNMQRNGRADVDGYLRPSSYDNVFAAGDVADGGDAMTIVGITSRIIECRLLIKNRHFISLRFLGCVICSLTPQYMYTPRCRNHHQCTHRLMHHCIINIDPRHHRRNT